MSSRKKLSAICLFWTDVNKIWKPPKKYKTRENHKTQHKEIIKKKSTEIENYIDNKPKVYPYK